jgi:hypothetical protein
MKHTGKENLLDLQSLLHPAQAFDHPLDVVRDPDLTLSEKRAILASWASDACAPEGAPGQRVNKAGNVVRWDDIMDALSTLDENHGKPLPHYKRVLAKKDAGLLRGRRLRPRNRNDEGAPLN